MEKIDNYAYSVKTELGFDQAIEKVTTLLSEVGFGILTEIDVTATLKKKLDVDYKPYKILGACNPPFAYKTLQADESIGVFLPCNVVVKDDGDYRTVTILNPMVMSFVMNNDTINEVAKEVTEKLLSVMEKI